MKHAGNSESLFNKITAGYYQIKKPPTDISDTSVELEMFNAYCVPIVPNNYTKIDPVEEKNNKRLANIRKKYSAEISEGRKALSKYVIADEGLSVKALRLKAGMTQKELADACGLNQNVISEIEANIRERNPGWETMYKIITALSISKKDIGEVFFP